MDHAGKHKVLAPKSQSLRKSETTFVLPAMQDYSVPQESKKLLFGGLIGNKLHSSAPTEIKEAATFVEYVGSNTPFIPVNWRFAESISALKGFEGSMLNVLLKRKYGIDFQKITINTDRAQLYIMSPVVTTIDPLGANVRPCFDNFDKYIPNNANIQVLSGSHFQAACTNIYKTKDGRHYQLHASLDSSVCQKALELDPNTEVATSQEAVALYQNKILRYTAHDIETMMNDRFRQAGTTCWSTEEYKTSLQGKANAHIGLFEIHHIQNEHQKPGWWKSPVKDHNNHPTRPLSGLKVIDLTRIIAGPTISRELAELGASVLRITSPNLTDLTAVNFDLGWGKWNAYLDLTKDKDRATLREIIEESDVVVEGYRPGALGKWGFAKEDILGFFDGKDRGIIYTHENCYGWYGPWVNRSGWQQISDASCGISFEFGKAMGSDGPVTPVFPNSDFCAGVSGATGVLQALIEKSEKGGSFVVETALNYYSQWLINTCSTYSPEVWDDIWASYGRPVFQSTDNMGITIPRFLEMLKDTPIFNPDHLEIRYNKTLGLQFRSVKPVLEFPQGVVELGYNVGCRGNGVDKAKWPEDLLTEVII